MGAKIYNHNYIEKFQLFIIFFIPLLATTFHDTVLLCLLFLYFLTGRKGYEKKIFEKTLNLLFLLALLLFLASCFWSVDFASAFLEWLVIAFTTIVGIFTIYQIEELSYEKSTQIIKYSAYGLAVSAFLYIGNLSSGGYFYSLLHGNDPTIFNFEKYGKVARIFLMLYVCFLPYQLKHFSKKIVAVSYGLIAILSLQLFQITNILILFVAPLIAGGVYIFSQKYTRLIPIVFSLLFFFVPAIFVAIYYIFMHFDPLKGSWFFEIFQYYWSTRIDLWEFAIIKIIDEPLIGHGIESFRYFPLPVGFPNDPHNLSLQIYLDSGVLGVVLSSVIIGCLVKEAIGLEDASMRYTALFLFVAAFIVAMLYYPITREWWYAFLWLVSVYFILLKKYLKT